MRDFSYISHRIAGDGWVMAGDAFGFLDPVYSSGVFLAFRSGELAADAALAVHGTLEKVVEFPGQITAVQQSWKAFEVGGKITEMPTRDTIPIAAQEQLIVELYSK